jgi:head-tail adaptor
MSIRSNVDARRLDQRVVLERAQRDANGDVAGWAPLAPPVWASVDAEKANSPEAYRADGARSPGRYVIWIRADVHQRLGLQLSDRVAWNGLHLDIKDMPDQQLRGRLICLSGVSEN